MKHYLADYLSIDVLQRVQDAFSAMTGMAALTTDAHGVPLTEGSNFTVFCTKYARTSTVGCERCHQCDRFGAEESLRKGGPISYYCHAGLIDYAAPIMAGDEMVGSFIGGQVLSSPPDKKKMENIADELGVDRELFWEAAQKIKVIDKKSIDNAAKFLYTVANVLSDMAYGKYTMMEATLELERANNMKSDFLANMSHEIRTPMNAIIGMAEMALREDLTPSARDYIHQIKSSGRALLTIINDILDFSKIEAGKMDIIPVEYEPMSIVNDIANIAMERLKDKDVELILDISPDIPAKLYGDNIRIKQILINLVNNATKFTKIGKVAVKMSHKPMDDGGIMLRFDIEDTGMGIKESDMERIFNSFQQVDSKRNRNIEGTGLGLAISRQLTHQMGGEIFVQSEYDKGSTFSFELPQKVIDESPSSRVNSPDRIFALSMFENRYLRENFDADCIRLGVEHKEIASVDEIFADDGREKFFFIERQLFTPEIEFYIKDRPDITVVLLLPFQAVADSPESNMLILRKPIYTLNEAMIFNRESVHYFSGENDDADINFIAPKATVLVVDDNSINLTVTEGLLEPLRMQIDTALSGKEAINMISSRHYDLIFMDHMMPELDGVETTRIIRRLHPEYDDVPIIALTANAISGTKEEFLKEGMNDFVAKPIELKNLIAKVAQWLPVEKIEKTDAVFCADKPEDGEKIEISGLDTGSAIKLLGSSKLFWTVLKDYYNAIEKKHKAIKDAMENKDWALYTIEVHALKSTSRQVGATKLSDMAAELEKAGNARDINFINEQTDPMLVKYLSYIPILAPYFDAEQKVESKGEITQELLSGFFADMRSALDDLDMDMMESVRADMECYTYTDKEKELFAKLKEAVENIDVDDCEAIMKEWENLVS